MDNKTLTIKEARQRAPVHQSHSQDTWDANAIHNLEDTPWVRGSSLEMPPPRKGFRQRWIRVGIMGEDDATNTARKLREGWKPRPVDTIPSNFALPTISHGQFAGFCGVEGMLLCEMPEVLGKKRDAFVRNKTDRITDGIEAELQAQSDNRMQISQERRSSVGRMVKVADD